MTAGRPSPAESPNGGGRPQADGAPRRQFVKFSFFKLDPAWRRLPVEEREQGKQELCGAGEAFGGRVLIGRHSVVGVRGVADLLLWPVAAALGPSPAGCRNPDGV